MKTSKSDQGQSVTPDAQTEGQDGPATAPGTGWTGRLARSRLGLAILSLAESTVMPIPLEAIVVPLMVGHPKRALKIALIIWLGCLLGASLFYAAGYLLSEPVVMPALAFLGLEGAYAEMEARLSEGGLFWTVFLVSLLPAPLQLATLGAGALGGNFAVFFAAIVLSRGVRYFGMAILAQFIGQRIAQFDIPKRYIVLGLAGAMLLAWGGWKLLGG